MSGRVAEVSLPVTGMCCAEEAEQVESALRDVPGVTDVKTLLGAERVSVRFDRDQATEEALAHAIEAAGFHTPRAHGEVEEAGRDVARLIGWASLAMVALVVGLAALGERLGIFEDLVALLPWWVPALAIVLGGLPVLRGVARAALRRQVTSHTLMTVGVIASAAIGEWTTAALIVFFMRFADWVEERTTERARDAIRLLTRLAPQTARVIRNGVEHEVPAADVAAGEVIAVRPGERIAADGEVVTGTAAVDQSSLTGESVPIDVAPGSRVLASTLVQGGYLEVRALRTGADTTFAKVVRLVEEAESQKAPVQRFADRFTAFYLPLVLAIGVVTYLISGRVLNAVAVLVVACSCAIVIATPVVVLASVGTAARRGLLIKGGIVLEQLARVDALCIDKTGTLTFGRPEVTSVIPLGAELEPALLSSIATAEVRSEHPLGRAVSDAARRRGLAVGAPEDFRAFPGRGVVARLDGAEWAVGTRALLGERGVVVSGAAEARARVLEGRGQTVFFAARDGALVGLVALADRLRPDVAGALGRLRHLGIREVLLVTGDNERVAAAVATPLGIAYRAGLLPEAKLAAVRELQARGRVVLMVGDGVNDAPALAQADVGVAMGAAGSQVAIEAADVALLRDDWSLVPDAIRVGRSAAAKIRQNLAFAAVYNVVGIGLAATGILPPIWAAAAQSLPDVAILLNSARLLRSK